MNKTLFKTESLQLSSCFSFVYQTLLNDHDASQSHQLQHFSSVFASVAFVHFSVQVRLAEAVPRYRLHPFCHLLISSSLVAHQESITSYNRILENHAESGGRL